MAKRYFLFMVFHGIIAVFVMGYWYTDMTVPVISNVHQVRLKEDNIITVPINEKIPISADVDSNKTIAKLEHLVEPLTNETKRRLIKIPTTGAVPEDLLQLGPFHFLPESKNPCWYGQEVVKSDESKRKKLYCMPYFYLVGAPKCGTTDLFSRIMEHPQVFRTAKEPHWLTRKRFWGTFAERRKLTDFMQLYYSRIAKYLERRIRDNAGNTKIFGDGSASTFFDNSAWRRLPHNQSLSEPFYTNADYIHHLNPNTKIIVILRNPVDRAYSSFLFFNRNLEYSPSRFHAQVQYEIETMKRCTTQFTMRSCVYDNRMPPKSKVKLHIGIYYIHLLEFFRVFPREQVLVLKLEDFSENVPQHIKRVFAFLEIQPLSDAALGRISMKRLSNVNKRATHIGPMFNKSRKSLEQFYRDYNHRLVSILGKRFNYNKK